MILHKRTVKSLYWFLTYSCSVTTKCWDFTFLYTKHGPLDPKLGLLTPKLTPRDPFPTRANHYYTMCNSKDQNSTPSYNWRRGLHTRSISSHIYTTNIGHLEKIRRVNRAWRLVSRGAHIRYNVWNMRMKGCWRRHEGLRDYLNINLIFQLEEHHNKDQCVFIHIMNYTRFTLWNNSP